MSLNMFITKSQMSALNRYTFFSLLAFPLFICILIIIQILSEMGYIIKLFDNTDFLKLIIGFGPSFCGVIFGFALDRLIKEIEFRKKIDQILPYIEIELKQNFQVFHKAPVNISQNDFSVNYWEMYRGELANWQEVNVVPLTEIYSRIKKMENPDALQVHFLKELLSHQLEVYKNWYFDKLAEKAGKKGRREKRRVLEAYKTLPISSSTMLIINELEKELDEVEKLLDC